MNNNLDVVDYFKRVDDFINNHLSADIVEGIIFKRLVNFIGRDSFNDLVETTKDEVTPDGHDYSFTTFHRRFRQSDVSSSADIDMVFWHFILISNVPQKVYYAIQNKTFDGEPCDPDFLYFD